MKTAPVTTKDTTVRVLTSKRTTWLAVLAAILLYLASDTAAPQLRSVFRLTPDGAQRVVDFAKMLAAIFAAGGYSVLTRPEDKQKP